MSINVQRVILLHQDLSYRYFYQYWGPPWFMLSPWNRQGRDWAAVRRHWHSLTNRYLTGSRVLGFQQFICWATQPRSMDSSFQYCWLASESCIQDSRNPGTSAAASHFWYLSQWLMKFRRPSILERYGVCSRRHQTKEGASSMILLV